MCTFVPLRFFVRRRRRPSTVALFHAVVRSFSDNNNPDADDKQIDFGKDVQGGKREYELLHADAEQNVSG